MSVSKNNSFMDIQYITYPKELGRKGISYGSPIIFLYPSGVHEYMDFQGKIKEVRIFFCSIILTANYMLNRLILRL